MTAPIRKKAGGNQASLRERIKAWIHSRAFKSTLIVLLFSLITFLLYCAVCSPKRYDLEVGSISHETINASKDVVDEVTTEERRKSAAAAVEPTYRFQEGVKEEVLSSLAQLFGDLRTVQQYGVTLRSAEASRTGGFTDTEIEYAMELVKSLSLTRYQISTLLNTESERFEEMVSLVTTAVENSLNTTIREGQVNSSIQTIQQIVGYKLDVSLTQTIVPTVLRACIRPNMIIDQENMIIAQEKARAAVEPVIYLQGQNIIRQGERVTKSQLEMLRSLGLLKDNHYDFSVYRGAFLIVFLSMLCYVFGLYLLNRRILQDPGRLMVSMLVLIFGLGIAVLSHLFFSAYLTPTVLVPLLLTVLLGHAAGYASIIPYAILAAGFAAGHNSTYVYEMTILLLMSLAGGVVCIRFMKGSASRARLLGAGVVSSLVNAASVFAIAWMTSSDTFDPLSNVLWAMGGGILSGALALSAQPVFESMFHLATPSRLQELCNPNQPLLRRLLLEAPGTYHHSIIVANLAEAAAERIGANAYLARAAGYYHDIGKLKRPIYFKENQRGDNPHDRIDPYVSAAILTAHTRDGYQMAVKQHMPPELTSIIKQHHGNTPVMFFYHKALQLSNGSPVDINEFRYEGPLPDSREAAIVMLADTIEAAVRSMQDPTPKAIDQFIERLVRGKLEDGQLSDSPITLRDIDEICNAFSTVLKGVFHERIEYPEVLHRVPVQLKTNTPSSAVPEPDNAPSSPPPAVMKEIKNEHADSVPVQTSELRKEEPKAPPVSDASDSQPPASEISRNDTPEITDTERGEAES